MRKDVIILIAEDDESHFALLKKNFERSGVWNEIIRFADGEETLKFLFGQSGELRRKENKPYLLILDVRLPGVDGIEVLKRVKQDDRLKKLPVIVLSDHDDPQEVKRCYSLGCGMYLVKPADHEKFVDMVRKVGLFLSSVEVPQIDGILRTYK